MSIANLKGGFNVTMRVTQNGSPDSMCVLQKPFLKKSENWSLQVTDLFVNKTPALNLLLEEQFRIVPLEANGFSAGYRASDYIFTPKNCYTIMEYVIQVQEFFHKFSFLFWNYGIAHSLGTDEADENLFITGDAIATRPVNYTKKNFVPTGNEDAEGIAIFLDEGYGAVGKYPIICSSFLNSDLQLKFKLSKIFLSNFSLQFTDHFAKRLGLPQVLFYIETDAAVLEPPHIFIDVDALTIETREEVLVAEQTWVSDKTVRELDDRVSLDLFSTFPASRKINVVNGVEQHEHLLARFDLSDYKHFESISTHSQSEMSSTVEITETYEAGLENMTRGNSDYESNMLLNGSLQHIHLMLRTRYLEDGVMKSIPTAMEDGFWHCRLLFSKKV